MSHRQKKEMVKKSQLKPDAYRRDFYTKGNSKKIEGKLASTMGQPQMLTEMRNLANKKLRSAHEELYRKDEFISILGHELRNPLAPILHSLELIKLHDIQDPEVKDLLSVIERQTKILNNVTKSLLNTARAVGGKIQIQREPAEFGDILNKAIETARHFIELGKHTLEVHPLNAPVPMLLDPLRIEQIIVNLLNNAVKYTRPGGKITITVIQTDRSIVLSVKDTGIGISEEMMPHIFNLFAQANQPLAQFKGGLGVGLMLARTLAELHGGSLAAYSPGPGKGSEFILQLPIKKIPNDIQQASEDLVIKDLKLERRRVIVVDDNVTLADVFGKILCALNQDTTVVYNAASAIEAIHINIPDIIFIDIAMPTMNGYELLELLRKDSNLKQTKFIAISGFAEEYGEKNQKVHFDCHLVKPVGIAELKNVLS